MIVNEPLAVRRVIAARLFDSTGTPLASNHVFAVGDLKIVQPDGTIATAINLPTAVAGAAPGTFNIQVDQSEIQQAGDIRVQLSSASTLYWEWIEEIDPALPVADPTAIAAAVVAVAAQGIRVVQITPPTAGVTSYDVGDVEPPLVLKLPPDGANDTLAGAVSAQLRWKKPDGSVTVVALDLYDAIKRIVRRTWTAGDLALAGIHSGEVIITWPGGRTATSQTIFQWTVRASLS